MSDFEVAWTCFRERVENALQLHLDGHVAQAEYLTRAMRYATLGNGKRLRAMLVYASGQSFGASLEILDPVASAVELVHAFSLVHDDLPAMDDDAMRRGRPTCHIAYDEATAILAGDALQTLAFEILSTDVGLQIDATQRLKMVAVLSAATGAGGMAGGQSLDMLATGIEVDFEQLNTMHRLKTGALIKASCMLGGLAANVSDKQLAALENYGSTIGLAFQIVDDILDVTADSETLGKVAGADQKMQKSTFISHLGLSGARRECDNLCRQALETAGTLGDNPTLFKQLAQFVVERQY